MKELGNSFAQLAAIVMVLIMLAISTAAVSQWTSSSDDNSAAARAISAHGTTQNQANQTQATPAQSPLIAGARP